MFEQRPSAQRLALCCAAVVVVAVVAVLGMLSRRAASPAAQPAAARPAEAVGAAIETSPDAAARQVDLWEAERMPRQAADEQYVASQACRDCHRENYDSWYRSYHRTMTQVATPQSVLAPFDDQPLKQPDWRRTFHLRRRGHEFWVRMPDPEWEAHAQQAGTDLSQVRDPPLVDLPIVMTTGSHYMQTYWVPTAVGNEVRQFPWYYHIGEKQWIPREAAFLLPPGTPRNFKIWNQVCIKCHSTGARPRYDHDQRAMFSEVAEFGIACEACHGPGANHVARHGGRAVPEEKPAAAEQDTTIVNPARRSASIASQICGQCHSAFEPADVDDFMVRGLGFRPGDELAGSHRLHTFEESETRDFFYWNDGTCRAAGDEYNALIESPCYQQGQGDAQLSCLSCHSMHHSDPSGQLAAGMDANQACLQCHTSYRDRVAEHTHHPAGSSGSLCYNCHMPYTSYGLLRALRSHRVASPRVAPIGSHVRPNACNLCHLDQTLAWTSRYLFEWYQVPVVEVDEVERETAASVIWMLRGDAAQRAIAAWHAGWPPARQASGGPWQAPHLAFLLTDPYDAVRFIAARSLRSLPGFEGFSYDFLAPQAERAQAVHAVFEQWQDAPWQPAADLGRRVLIDSEGQPQPAAIRDLLIRRDMTPVAIAE